MRYVLGIDLGSTHCKALAMGEDGSVLNATRSDYPGDPGPIERQDVEAVWGGVVEVATGASRRLGRAPAALALSGAMHTLVLVEEDGTPLDSAMTWADGRAAPQAGRLARSREAEGLYRATGCPPAHVYHPARLRWWAEERPDLLDRARLAVSVKDWVLHRLTGRWGSDRGLASTTGLLHLDRPEWHAGALRAAGARSDLLPPVVPTDAVWGELHPEAAAATGLPPGTPTVPGSSDGALSHVGAGATAVGAVVASVGTTAAVRLVTGEPWFEPARRTWCYWLGDGRWLTGAASNNGGLVLEWVRRAFYSELSEAEAYRRLLAEAAEVPPGSGGVRVVPYLAGERSPHWDPSLRGSVHGLDPGHGRGHVARAAMEAVAVVLADLLDLLPAEEDAPILATGALAAIRPWAAMLADLTGRVVLPLVGEDASTVGAAILAWRGIAEGGPAEGPAERGPPLEPQQASARHHRRVRDELHGLVAGHRGFPGSRAGKEPGGDRAHLPGSY